MFPVFLPMPRVLARSLSRPVRLGRTLSRLIHSSVRSFVYLFGYFCYFLDKWNDQVSQVDADDLIEEDLRGCVHDLARLRSLPALIASLIELGA